MDNHAAVHAEGLVKHYKSRNEVVEAVRGVDLTIRSGEVFGFLGPNGAGKSTTVKMLTTLLSITSGTATVAGVDVQQDPDGARHKMGVALQEAGLDPRQTGRELLILQGRLFELSRAGGGGARRVAARARRARRRGGPARSRPIPAACGAGSTWLRRSCTSPRCCSSTSRRPGSTPRAG